MRTLRVLVVLLLGWLSIGMSSAGTICPAGSGAIPFTHSPDSTGTGCNVVLTINPDLSVSAVVKDPAPYEGSEDALVGVVNNSAGSVGSLTLTGNGIFGFESDGICTFTFVGSGYCSPSQVAGVDPGDYAGPTTSFTNLSANSNTGTVVFNGGLAPGASTYFSLEGVPTSSITGGAGPGGGGTVTTIPTLSTAALVLLLLASLGVGFWHLRDRQTRG
jgi:hypothetical protein